MTKYPLEALLNVRRRALEGAKRALAAGLERLNREREAWERARRSLEDAEAAVQRFRDRMRQTGGPNMGRVASYRAAQARLDWLKGRVEERRRDVDAAADALARAEQEVEDLRQRLARARQELEVLERHREAWEREVRRRREAAEEEAAEEASISAFVRREDE